MILDLFFVSRLGNYAIAARGTATYVIMLISAPIVGALFASYTTILSQTHATGSRDALSRCFRKLFTISLLASALLASLYVSLCPSLVHLICPDERIDKLALDYIFRGYIYGLPGLTLFIQYLSLLYGRGKTREASICWILSDIFYILCDPILIFYMGLGIAGSGLAFTLSLYFPVPLMHLLNKDLGNLAKIDIKIDRNIINTLTHVGFFTYLERLIISGLYSTYCGIIARYGDIIYTAYQLGLTLESFVYMPILAFRDISNIVIGHAVVREKENISNILKRILEVSIIMTTPLAMLIILLSPFITTRFTNSIKIAELASTYITIAAISDIGHAVTLAEVGAYQGTGNALYAFITDTLTMALTRVIPALALASYHVNIIYIWILMDIDAIMRGIVLYTTFIKTIIKRVRIFV